MYLSPQTNWTVLRSSYVSYELLDGDKAIHSHKECVQEPINLMSDFRDSLPNFPTPNVVSVRWSYKDAVAKALSELNEELSEVPNDIILHAFIKDGGDGLGHVSQYKEKGHRCLSDTAFRYAFCIMNVKMEDGRRNENNMGGGGPRVCSD